MSDQNNSPAPQAAPEAPVSESQVQDSSENEGSPQEQQASPKDSAPKAQEKKRIKQLQLKIDGAESTEDLPFEIDEEYADYMRKNLQLSKKAQKSMQSEASLKAQVEHFVKSLTSDTKNTLKQIGIDPKALAAQIIEEELEMQAMSPEQKRQMELEAELKKLKAERESEKEDFNKREFERLQQQEYEKVDAKMTTVLEKAGIPKKPYVVKKIAQYMLDGAQAGINLEPEDVIDLVKEEIHSDIKELIDALGEDKVESFIGKDVLDKVRKKNLSRAKQTPASVKAAIKDVGASKKDTSKPADKISMKDFFKI